MDPSNFATGGPLFEATSSNGPGEEADPNINADRNDNGIDDPDPVTNGIASNPVVLVYQDEPQSEPGSSGNALDRDSNLTVDFGFFGVTEPPLYTIPTLGSPGFLLLFVLLGGSALGILRRRRD